MKISKTTKLAISAAIAALLVDMWRGFPWLGKVFPTLRPTSPNDAPAS
jgi:hypothetical protein